eukprot:8250912-Alexandrium_andersonii.AAC.1
MACPACGHLVWRLCLPDLPQMTCPARRRCQAGCREDRATQAPPFPDTPVWRLQREPGNDGNPRPGERPSRARGGQHRRSQCYFTLGAAKRASVLLAGSCACPGGCRPQEAGAPQAGSGKFGRLQVRMQ